MDAPPQTVVFLDERSLIVGASRSDAGPFFRLNQDAGGLDVHELLHEHCRGDCDFQKRWTRALRQFQDRSVVEWEVDDERMKKILRFSLLKPPKSRDQNPGSKRAHAILSIKDITDFRRPAVSSGSRDGQLNAMLREKDRALSEALEALARAKTALASQDLDLVGYETKDRALRHRLMRAEATERKRIASDLHDGLAQTLGAIKYGIETCARKLIEHGDSEHAKQLDGTIGLIKTAHEEVRRITSNLVPPRIDEHGLLTALAWLCKELNTHKQGMTFRFSADIVEADVPLLLKPVIYRIAQEGLNNATKHSGAARVDLAIKGLGDGIALSLADDGRGFVFDADGLCASDHLGYGLCSMSERAGATDGSFSIDTAPGKGTTLTVSWSAREIDSLTESRNRS